MELCYIWVEDYKAFKNQGFNLHPQFRFTFTPAENHPSGQNTLEMKPKEDFLPIFQKRSTAGKPNGNGSPQPTEASDQPNASEQPDAPIQHITAIIGQNGTGKSSIFELVILLMHALEKGDAPFKFGIEAKDILGEPEKGKSPPRLMYVFKTSMTDLKFENTGEHNADVLKPFGFQKDQHLFLVLANIASLQCSLKAVRGGGFPYLEGMRTGLFAVYYNHTLEDPFLKFSASVWRKKFLPKGKASYFLQIPKRLTHQLSMRDVERQTAAGFLRMAKRNSTPGRDVTFLWQPQWVVLKARVDIVTTLSPDFGDLKQALEKLKDFFHKGNPRTLEKATLTIYLDLDHLKLGNAMALLTMVIAFAVERDVIDQFFGESKLDLGKIYQLNHLDSGLANAIVPPLRRIQRSIFEAKVPILGKQDADYQLFLSQLDSGLHFDEMLATLIQTQAAPYSNSKELFWEIGSLTERLTTCFENLPLWIDLDFCDHPLSGRRFSLLSNGERLMLSVLATTQDVLTQLHNQPKPAPTLLMMDEPDIGLHPEWQRKMIQHLHHGLGVDGQKIQLILASHSPFVASDLPHTHIARLKRYDPKDLASIADPKERQRLEAMQLQPGQPYQADWPSKTFGGNIHTLLADNFFLDHTVGEFARSRIQQVLNFCLKVQRCHELVVEDVGVPMDERGRQRVKAELKADLQAFAQKSDSDFRSRQYMETITKLIGEPVLANVLANNLAALERIQASYSDQSL